MDMTGELCSSSCRLLVVCCVLCQMNAITDQRDTCRVVWQGLFTCPVVGQTNDFWAIGQQAYLLLPCYIPDSSTILLMSGSAVLRRDESC